MTDTTTNTASETVAFTPMSAWASNSAAYEKVSELVGGARTTLATSGALAERIAKIAETAPDLPVAIAGQADVDASDFTADALPEPGDAGFVLAMVQKRGIVCDDGKKRDGFIGLAVYPSHSLDAILAEDGGTTYLTRLAQKEMGHVAFRGLRLDTDAEGREAFTAASQGMPQSVSDFIVRTRQGGTGSPYAVFNDNWLAFKRRLQSDPKVPTQLTNTLPPKKDMLSCIRSASYAAKHYTALEDASIFAKLALGMANVLEAVQAKEDEAGTERTVEGDPDAIRQWVAQRESIHFDTETNAGDLSALDFSSLGV